MLIDEEGNFLSQRRVPRMALLQTTVANDVLNIFHKSSSELQINIPLDDNLFSGNNLINTYMWDETINVVECGSNYDEWFSEVLQTKCKFVYMPDKSNRLVDDKFAHNNEITSLSDGYPFLIIGEESLNLLNSKLDEPLPMNRFRPNLVFAGGIPHDEDNFGKFTINFVRFSAVKPCARCTITTVDQESGIAGKEPLKTLAAYRTVNNKVMFGQNLLHSGSGNINVGDKIILHDQKF